MVGKSYLPKSPLSALPATGVLAGFGNNFMTNHAFGRGTVAVPVKWIDSLVPHARVILQAVRLRNRTRTGKADFSGQHCVESTLYLVRCLLCSLQISAVHARQSADWHVFNVTRYSSSYAAKIITYFSTPTRNSFVIVESSGSSCRCDF